MSDEHMSADGVTMTNVLNKVSVHIRWLIRRDMAEVLEIEESCYPFPWTRDDFIQNLRRRNCIGMVAEHDEHVVGFMIYDLKRSGLELLNFAVHPNIRRCGVGEQMVEQMVEKLNPERRTSIVVTVSEYNLDAQLFFRDMGFLATGKVERYDNGDAYEMVYHINWTLCFRAQRQSMT